MSSNMYTDLMVTSLRDVFNSGKTKSVSFRIEQLKNLERMVKENQDDMLDALAKDLRKPKFEGLLFEIEAILNEITYFIENCEKWAKDEKLAVNLLLVLDSAYIRKEPYGVVLILGTWNYPFSTSLRPALGAISAGNCVIVKPSEMTSHSARLMADLFPKYMDKECYRVVLAEVEETKDLLTNMFDYIFFTGSPAVGRAVMAAAAPHLTPVTLELGGKSPCYVDESADIELAVRRVLFGKCLNLGQICVSPDYVLCSKNVEKIFVQFAEKVLKERYGDDLQRSPDLCRIVNRRHWERLQNLLISTSGRISLGGKSDENDLWIEPTIVTDVSSNDPIMEEEIFGPILPIVTVNSLHEVIDFINKRPKPLALYSFAKNDSVNKELVQATSSGSVCLNDTLTQIGWPDLPCGGVGNSGMGCFQGKYSFDTFSHHRSILNRCFSEISEKINVIRYPPYTEDKLRVFKRSARMIRSSNLTGARFLIYFLCVLLLVALFWRFTYAVKTPSSNN